MGIWSSITDELKIEIGMIKYNCQWKAYYEADDVFVALLLSDDTIFFKYKFSLSFLSNFVKFWAMFCSCATFDRSIILPLIYPIFSSISLGNHHFCFVLFLDGQTAVAFCIICLFSLPLLCWFQLKVKTG